jgi:hypothetical protein
MRLFNKQMASLFQTLARIDEIMKNEHLITNNSDTKVTIEKDDDNDTIVKLMKSQAEIIVKPLPEWFTSSTVYTEPDQTNPS